MKNIETELKNIAEYFQNKIIDGDFEFKSCGGCTATVLIDGKYEFKLWIANEPKNNFDFYNSNFISVDSVNLLCFKTQKKRLAGWKQIKPFVKKYRNEILLKEKQKELDALNKEIQALNFK